MTPDHAHEDERDWLQDVLTREIPLGGAMDLRVARLDDAGIELELPLAPNINDKGTAFGGALASAMILAGWALPRLLLRRGDIRADLVIGRCEIRYIQPVNTAFRAMCSWPPESAIRLFTRKLEQSGRAGLGLHPEIHAGGQVAATLTAKYASLRT